MTKEQAKRASDEILKQFQIWGDLSCPFYPHEDGVVRWLMNTIHV